MPENENKPEVASGLRVATRDEVRKLEQTIGKKAINTIDSWNAPLLVPKSKRNRDVKRSIKSGEEKTHFRGFYYYFIVDDRCVTLTTVLKRKSKRKKLFFKKEILSEELSVVVSHVFERDLINIPNHKKHRESIYLEKEKNISSTGIHPGEKTVRFLRRMKELITDISENCTVNLFPVDGQRYRVFSRAFKGNENVVMVPPDEYED